MHQLQSSTNYHDIVLSLAPFEVDLRNARNSTKRAASQSMANDDKDNDANNVKCLMRSKCCISIHLYTDHS